MTLVLILGISGLGLVDSLNPFTIAAVAYLLSLRDPLRRTSAFVLATLVTYFLCGLLLLEGWLAALAYLLPLLPFWLVGVLEVVAGLALLAFGLWTLREAGQGAALTPPASPSLVAIVIFAVTVTASDLPTAIPYFAAVNRIASATQSLAPQLALLAWYNLLYVSPLVAMIVLQGLVAPAARARSVQMLRRWIDVGFAKVLPPVTALCGLGLLIDGSLRVAGG